MSRTRTFLNAGVLIGNSCQQTRCMPECLYTPIHQQHSVNSKRMPPCIPVCEAKPFIHAFNCCVHCRIFQCADNSAGLDSSFLAQHCLLEGWKTLSIWVKLQNAWLLCGLSPFVVPATPPFTRPPERRPRTLEINPFRALSAEGMHATVCELNHARVEQGGAEPQRL